MKIFLTFIALLLISINSHSYSGIHKDCNNVEVKVTKHKDAKCEDKPFYKGNIKKFT